MCGNLACTGVLMIYWVLTECMGLPAVAIILFSVWFLLFNIFNHLDIIRKTKEAKEDSQFINKFFANLEGKDGTLEPEKL